MTPVTPIIRSELREELVAAGELVPVAVDGLRGPRYIVASDRGHLADAVDEVARGDARNAESVAFLAPLDPLAWDRDLLRRLFGFDYVWEVYVPAAKRRWGYYVLPILFGDRFVGRFEPRIERTEGRLRILAAVLGARLRPRARGRLRPGDARRAGRVSALRPGPDDRLARRPGRERRLFGVRPKGA